MNPITEKRTAQNTFLYVAARPISMGYAQPLRMARKCLPQHRVSGWQDVNASLEMKAVFCVFSVREISEIEGK